MAPGLPITSPGILPWEAVKILLIFVSEAKIRIFIFIDQYTAECISQGQP